jgi:hypothetical protein
MMIPSWVGTSCADVKLLPQRNKVIAQSTKSDAADVLSFIFKISRLVKQIRKTINKRWKDFSLPN